MVIVSAFGAIKEIEDAPEYDWFLFSDQTLTVQTWIYFSLEHVAKMRFNYLVWKWIPWYKNTFKIWFYISIFNAIQFIFKYDSMYEELSYGWVVFSSHIITTFILARAIYNEKW